MRASRGRSGRAAAQGRAAATSTTRRGGRAAANGTRRCSRAAAAAAGAGPIRRGSRAGASRLARLCSRRGALIGGQSKWILGVYDAILLAGRVAGVARALPALGDATGGRVTRDVGGAPGRLAEGVGSAAQDNVAAHAVACIGFCAVNFGARG